MLMLLRMLHIWKNDLLHWHKLCQPLQSQNWVTQKSWCMLHITFSDVFHVYLYSKGSNVHKNLQSAQICMCNTTFFLNNALSYAWKFIKKPFFTNTIKTNWWKLQKKIKSKPFCYSESKSSDVVVGRGTQEHLFRLHILMRTTGSAGFIGWWLHVQMVVNHRLRLAGRLKHEIVEFPQWHEIDAGAVLLLHYRQICRRERQTCRQQPKCTRHWLLVVFSSNEWKNSRGVQSGEGMKVNRVWWGRNCVVFPKRRLRFWVWAFLFVLHQFFPLFSSMAMHLAFFFRKGCEALTFSKFGTSVFEPHLRKHVLLI